MRERYGAHAKAAFLTVTPLNVGGRSVKNIKLGSITSAIMLDHVLKAMNQSGRTIFSIRELVFKLTVIFHTIGRRISTREVVDSCRNRSIIES